MIARSPKGQPDLDRRALSYIAPQHQGAGGLRGTSIDHRHPNPVDPLVVKTGSMAQLA
jgi:hypothetical protein